VLFSVDFYRITYSPPLVALKSAVTFLFVFNNKLWEGVFRTFGILKPSYFSRIELVMKKRPSTTKGLLLGVFFSAEGPQDGDTVCKRQDRMLKLQRTCVEKPKVNIFGLR
jgi:hypothetical protein